MSTRGEAHARARPHSQLTKSGATDGIVIPALPIPRVSQGEAALDGMGCQLQGSHRALVAA